MKKEILPGSHWSAGTDKKFIVIHVVEVDGHMWVHYRDAKGSEPKEYSCYLESFEQRFTKLPE
jgi:hypothetical protein